MIKKEMKKYTSENKALYSMHIEANNKENRSVPLVKGEKKSIVREKDGEQRIRMMISSNNEVLNAVDPSHFSV